MTPNTLQGDEGIERECVCVECTCVTQGPVKRLRYINLCLEVIAQL